jgi:hypothetical protein
MLVSPGPNVQLGQTVRRLSDPVDVVGVVVGIVFQGCREVLVRWADPTDAFGRNVGLNPRPSQLAPVRRRSTAATFELPDNLVDAHRVAA